MTDYVVGFYRTPDNKLCCVRKNRPAWQAGKLNGVGGKIEGHESPKHAMLREFREETGKQTSINDWEYKAELRGQRSHIFFFTAVGPAFDAVPEEGEPIEWVDADCLPPDCLPNLRALVPLCFSEHFVHPIVLLEEYP